jgi:hypothetical protein
MLHASSKGNPEGNMIHNGGSHIDPLDTKFESGWIKAEHAAKKWAGASTQEKLAFRPSLKASKWEPGTYKAS